MLSDLLKKYVKDTLEYFDKYSVGYIQISARGVDEAPVSDQVCWTLDCQKKQLNSDAILKAVEDDWGVIGSEVGEQYQVVVDINFQTQNGATVQYNDTLVITVDDDEDDSEEAVYSKPNAVPTQEDFEAVLEGLKEAFKQWKVLREKANNKDCCRGSIHSCSFHPDEYFF